MTTIIRKRPACRNRHTRKRFSLLLVSAGLLAFFFTTAFAGSASAYDCDNGREITFKLKNDNGVPQYSVDTWVRLDGVWQLAGEMNDYDKSLFFETVDCLENGDRVRVTRYWDKADPSNPENAPEGIGADYTITVNSPSVIELTVPSFLKKASVSSTLSDQERALLGLINQKRKSLGLRAIPISLTLRDYNASLRSFTLKSTYPDEDKLIWDTGLVPSNFWTHPPGLHYFNYRFEGSTWPDWPRWMKRDFPLAFDYGTTDPSLDSIDIQIFKSKVGIVFFDNCSDEINAKSCRLTDEYGSLKAFNGSSSPGPNKPGVKKKNPRFRVMTRARKSNKRKRSKKRLKAIAFVKKAAKGNSFVRLRVAGKARRIKARRFGKKFVYVLKVSKKARISRVSTFCFKGIDGWKSSCVKKPSRKAFQ